VVVGFPGNSAKASVENLRRGLDILMNLGVNLLSAKTQWPNQNQRLAWGLPLTVCSVQKQMARTV